MFPEIRMIHLTTKKQKTKKSHVEAEAITFYGATEPVPRGFRGCGVCIRFSCSSLSLHVTYVYVAIWASSGILVC